MTKTKRGRRDGVARTSGNGTPGLASTVLCIFLASSFKAIGGSNLARVMGRATSAGTR